MKMLVATLIAAALGFAVTYCLIHASKSQMSAEISIGNVQVFAKL